MGIVRSARLCVAALALGCVALGSGCAEERDPISQVDVGALPKAFFVGEQLEDAADDPEFYFRTTVVDVAAGAGSEELFTSSDAQPTVRIRWEITERKLIARLAYELIDNTDGTGTGGGARNDEPRPAAKDGNPAPKVPARTTTDGQIVASFDIQKQFDIRRGYNPETGEENNTIEENDKDRPWNQRQYVRVDWSKNLVTDAYTLDAVSQMGLYGGIKWDPVAYQVSDPRHPDAPVLDTEHGYLDITQKAFASPQVIHDEEFGYDYPVCELVGEFPRTSCNPSEVKLRLAFKKVVDTDYEPSDLGGRAMELFGYFTNDRFGYDRRYGIVDEKWHRFVSRWNVFERSHDVRKLDCATPERTPTGADVHRDLDHDGTEDECQTVGRGSRCDEFSHLCTMPYRDRAVKTIPWYVNRDYPAELFEGGHKVVTSWSDGIRVGLLAGRLAECRRTKEADCESKLGWPARWSDDFVPPVGTGPNEVPQVMVLCHNPVDRKVDAEICGEDGLSPRMGDLRYNFFTYVVSAQQQGRWGIMVDAEDPLTGEKIAGSVNQWGATLDKAAAQLVDLVELINGTTSPEAFISGKDVSDWVKTNSAGGLTEKPTPMGADELAQRLGAFDPQAMNSFATGVAKPHTGPKALQLRERMRALESAGKLGPGNPALMQRLGKLRGSDLEAKMITPASVVDGRGRVRRGYMFSSDEFADTGNVPSFRYDAGADPYEQVKFLETAYENRYVLDAFRRGRTMFNSEGVVSRVQAHYLDTIQLLAKTFAFAMVLEVDDPSKPTATLLGDGQYGPLSVSASVGFDLFTRMLTRPEPGSYCSTGSDKCPGVQPYGLTDYIYVADPNPLPASRPYDFTIALGKGRYIHNDFDYSQGYWWGDYQKQVGSFYDKTWAIYYLAEAFDSFVSNSKEDFIDGRYKNVNFATIYPEQMRRLFGTLLTGDLETMAPWSDGSGGANANLTYPSWSLPTGLGTRPAPPKLVDPAFGFNEQLYAMVWGTMLFPTGWSRTWIDDTRITALASEQVSWNALETYVFIDPATSIAYKARTTGTEKLFGVDHEKSTGARMLEWANNLVYEAYLVEVDAQGYYRLNADGTPKLKLKDGKPQLNPDIPGGDAALKRYVANIEVMRQLVSRFVVPLESTLPSP